MTNSYIENQLKAHQQLLLFLPDGFKIGSLSRGFIFTLIHQIKPDLYEKMKQLVREQRILRKQKKHSQFEIDVKGDLRKNWKKPLT